MKNTKALALTVALAGLVSTAALAAGIDDPARAPYYAAFDGKTVAFVPQGMGYDLTEGWAAGLKKYLAPLGVKIEIRDPNYNTDAGAQAITELIQQKPDAIVVQNPDVQSYSKLLKKANEAGIYVIQVNMRSTYTSDSFVGADYVGMGEVLANRMIDKCSPANGGNGKISITQGVITAAASALQMKGIDNVLSKHPEMKVVSSQAADWDATKARSIMATVLQSNPDLCAAAGFWDVMDVGTAAAIREAKKNVYVITEGGGNQAACDNLNNGSFDEVIVFDVPEQSRDITDMLKSLFQNKPPAGSTHTTLFTPLKYFTKDTLKPGACWAFEAKK